MRLFKVTRFIKLVIVCELSLEGEGKERENFERYYHV